MIKIKSPQLVKNLFSEQDYLELKKLFNNPYSFTFDSNFHRYTLHDQEELKLKKFAKIITNKARDIFESDTLLPTYALFAHYQGQNPNLFKHKDDNACTYTLDMCVYQTKPWDLWVENKAYTILENQALAYYGNDQLHWREKFPYSTSDYVAMIFFHFAEPEHWYFTKGSSYISVIRGNMSEEEWKSSI